MRPLKRESLKPLKDTSAYPNKRKYLAFRLLETFGEFCSICEMRIGQEKIEHHKLYKEWQKKLSAKDWPDLLVLCADCRRHMTKEELKKKSLGNYLWPDNDRTFSIPPTLSPFLYEKIEVEQTIVQEDKRKIKSKKPFIRIRVNPALSKKITRKAQNTIDLFQLNTPFLQTGKKKLVIPVSDYLQATDMRAEQRLKSWNEAEETAAGLKALMKKKKNNNSTALEDNILHLISLTAKACGNWSVWATVFWNEFEDVALLNSIFVEKRQEGISENIFVGTNKQVLVPR